MVAGEFSGDANRDLSGIGLGIVNEFLDAADLRIFSSRPDPIGVDSKRQSGFKSSVLKSASF